MKEASALADVLRLGGVLVTTLFRSKLPLFELYVVMSQAPVPFADLPALLQVTRADIDIPTAKYTTVLPYEDKPGDLWMLVSEAHRQPRPEPRTLIRSAVFSAVPARSIWHVLP